MQAAQTAQAEKRGDAETYANKIIPEARGDAARLVQEAEAYRQQAIAEASGEAKQFLAVYEQYKKAPDVTRIRMYLETMERVLGGTDKTIIDTGPQSGPGVVPYLSLNGVTPSPQAPTGGKP